MRNAVGRANRFRSVWQTGMSARHPPGRWFTPESSPFPLGRAMTATQRTPCERTTAMKSGIHPQYNVTTVTCSCGNTFTTRSTAKNGQIHTESCNACHPFYTGKQRVLDTAGRVAKFQAKYAKVNKAAK